MTFYAFAPSFPLLKCRKPSPITNPIRPFRMSAGSPPRRPTPALKPTSVPTTELPPGYKPVRTKIFLTMLASYATYYLTRSTFPFAAPLMQKNLSLSLEQVGLISSCFPAAYGISKLFAGILADLKSRRTIITTGLLLAAAANVAFVCGTSVTHFALLWGLNGVVSALGFPACAKLISTWYTPQERGTYWGMLNVSLNIGAAAAPLLVAGVAARFGWRYGMVIPALIAVVMALVSARFIVDSPREAGLPPTPLLPPEEKKMDQTKSKDGNGRNAIMTQLRGGILSSRAVWILAAAYFFVYVIRQALSSWTVFYLLQHSGVRSLPEAGLRLSGLEIGGLLGSVSAGYVSDYFVRRNGSVGAIGLRLRVVLGYITLTALAATLFFSIPSTAALLPVQWMLFALTGMGLYGQQLLVGLCSAECVDRRFAGTSNGFVGVAAYAGATLAGLPMSMVVKRFGWGSLRTVVVGCCVVVAVLLLPLLRQRSHEQKQLDTAKLQ